MKNTILIMVSMLASWCAMSQDFVYEPVNPAFGGNNYYNYQMLLSSAQAQNLIKEPTSQSLSNSYSRDPIDDFEASLNRQILNELSRSIMKEQFGENSLEEGNYLVGDYQIDITNTIEGISVYILDLSTGNETTVIIPYF